MKVLFSLPQVVLILFAFEAIAGEICPVSDVVSEDFVADICSVPEKYQTLKDGEEKRKMTSQNRAVRKALEDFLDNQYRDAIQSAEKQFKEDKREAEKTLNETTPIVSFLPEGEKLKGLRGAMGHYEKLVNDEAYLHRCLKIDPEKFQKKPEAYTQRIENARKTILTKQEKLVERIAKLESLDLSNRIKDKKQEYENLKGRLDAMVEAIVDSKCRSLDIFKWVKRDASFYKTSAILKNSGKILSSHNSEEEANVYIQELLKSNPALFNCKITPKEVNVSVTKNKDGKVIHSIQREPPLETVKETSKFAGEVFKDNSKELSKGGKQALDDMISDMGLGNLRSTDVAGVEEVNIYSCASLYRNCGTNSDSGEDNSCETIRLMRDFSDEELKKRTDLSPKAKSELERIFENPIYQKKYNEMAANPEQVPFPLLNEMRLWLAISTLRGESTKDALLSRLKEKGIVLHPDKIRVDPTGRPDDHFNNSQNIEGGLGLAGTCGPLPKNDQFYGKYCHMPANSCSPLSVLCKNIKEYYEQDEIKEELKNTISNRDAKDEYGAHRYFSASIKWKISSPEVVGSSNEDIEGHELAPKSVTKYQVGCDKVNFSCSEEKLIEVHIELPKFSSGNNNYNATRKSGKNKMTACPTNFY